MSRSRLAPEVFALPVDRLREGYYSDAYFNGAKRVLEAKDLHPRVTMQVFQKTDGAVLGGMDEALADAAAAARVATRARARTRVWRDGWDQLVVHALYDGDELSAWETVLTIEGDYSLFAHLETVYLGALSRRTLISTNVRRVVEAAARQADPVLPGALRPLPGADRRRVRRARRRRHRRQHRRAGVVVGRQGHRHGAARAHRRLRRRHGRGGAAPSPTCHYPEINVTALVDWDNDCVATSLACARALGERLWGVRLDTSETMVDRSLWDEMGAFRPNGVAPELVRAVRRALDDEGFQRVNIVVSGGFDAERIRRFEAAGVPADAYGVGSSLLRGNTDFTADVVLLEGRPCAKVGRRYRPNPRLERVT